MSKAERIINRCPRFYKGWASDSVISKMVTSIASELDIVEESIADLMSGHWVDTANGIDLDKIGNMVGIKRGIQEDDVSFRAHIKHAVDEYRGGGTLTAILNELQSLLGSDGIMIVENPELDSHAEFFVMANDTWHLGSNSINNEVSNLSLTVEDVGAISHPTVSNIDTGYSLTFQGELRSKEKLEIKDGSAFVGERDVSKQVNPLDIPLLLRKGSSWKYSEALLEGIGVFDKGRFDEQTFAIGVPTVKIRYEWVRRQPATFMLKVKPEALRKNGLTEDCINDKLSSIRAAGISVIVKVMEF
jgi:hypothetical protein